MKSFLQFGESLPIYKPTLPPMVFGPNDRKIISGKDALVLRYLTPHGKPHGKWNIHSTYQDNQHMLTLFRGGPTVWISDVDAAGHDIQDNDWVEVYNRNGVVTARAVVSHRMPKSPDAKRDDVYVSCARQAYQCTRFRDYRYAWGKS